MLKGNDFIKRRKDIVSNTVRSEYNHKLAILFRSVRLLVKKKNERRGIIDKIRVGRVVAQKEEGR